MIYNINTGLVFKGLLICFIFECFWFENVFLILLQFDSPLKFDFGTSQLSPKLPVGLI